MQAELQRQFTAIACIEARMAANSQGINELSLSYSQLTKRVEKDIAAQDLLKRLAGWLLFGLYKTSSFSRSCIVEAVQSGSRIRKKQLLKSC